MNTPTSPSPIRPNIDEKVKIAVKKELKEYHKILYAFLLGVGLFVTISVVTGVISERSLVGLLHDYIFSFDENLNRALSHNVAVGYNNQFWLGTHSDLERTANVPFYYAHGQGQEAVLLLDIEHFGIGREHRVFVMLDQDPNPYWENKGDIHYHRLDLTRLMDSRGHATGGTENIHILTFDIDEEGEPTQDKVLIRALVNVFGREQE